MRRLLAVAISGSWAGEWQQAQGNESSVCAEPVGTGEEVWLEMWVNGDGARKFVRVKLSAEPLSLVGLNVEQYRVVKDASRAVTAAPTSVEMMLNNGRVH